ncbi:hypothetical protein MHBO_002049 [Bonamia ostreae]|uniref:Uncharacterized protein n=1 Tax=Bonamia ostreae TaxID=126728 RepID=A0ABV2AL31_9EUKA
MNTINIIILFQIHFLLFAKFSLSSNSTILNNSCPLPKLTEDQTFKKTTTIFKDKSTKTLFCKEKKFYNSAIRYNVFEKKILCDVEKQKYFDVENGQKYDFESTEICHYSYILVSCTFISVAYSLLNCLNLLRLYFKNNNEENNNDNQNIEMEVL